VREAWLDIEAGRGAHGAQGDRAVHGAGARRRESKERVFVVAEAEAEGVLSQR